MPLRGNAGFKYIPYGGSLTTHAMEWELQNPRPAMVRSRWEAWSLDKTTREALVVGDGVNDIIAEIRFENTPEDLLAMLDECANGTALTYYPDLDTPGTNYPCELVAPSGNEVYLERDAILGIRGRYQATVRLRRTDGGNFDALL